MNKSYTKPFGHPQHWKYSQDQELTEAIQAYLEHEPITQGQQEIVVEYVRYFIEAPAYNSRPMIAYVRANLQEIKTRDDLQLLLQQIQTQGLMPL